MQYLYKVPIVPDEFELIIRMDHENPDKYLVFFHDIEDNELEAKGFIRASEIKTFVTAAFKIWNKDYPTKEVISP